MELVNGITLADEIEKIGLRLPMKRAIKIFIPRLLLRFTMRTNTASFIET